MTARILIVENVPAEARPLEARLAADSHQVATAPDAYEALRLVRLWRPDLILLDAALGLDAAETCRRLKSDAAAAQLPVLLVAPPGEIRARGLEAGADDFLAPTVEYELLLARLRCQLRLKRGFDEWRARGETARALGLATDARPDLPVAEARALVVEDWDPVAGDIQAALAREGIVAGRARDEAEAVALAGAITFDLVVLSLSLPGADPLRLAAKLRAEEASHGATDLPLLLLAEPAQRGRLLRGFETGANDWVLRPVDEHELRARARGQIRRKLYRDRLRADLGRAPGATLTDPLTDLHSQRYLMHHLRGLLGPGARESVAVLLIGLDHFRTVNERWGRAAGDRALRAVAEVLRARTRAFDSIARYGGDEFAVVIAGAEAAEALGAAERLRAAIEAMPLVVEDEKRHQLTVSIGVAATSEGRTGEEGTRPDTLLGAARQALGAAKRGGRNRVVLAAPV